VGEFGVLSLAKYRQPEDILKRFSALAAYLYDVPVPTEFNRHGELYTAALLRLCYPVSGVNGCATENASLKAFHRDFEQKTGQRLLALAETAQELITDNETYHGSLFSILQQLSVAKDPSGAQQLPAQLREFA